MASQPFLLFLDADDEWIDGFLESISLLINSFPKCSVFGTAYKRQWPDGSVAYPSFTDTPTGLGGGILTNYFRASGRGWPPICSSAVCIKKTAFSFIGGFPVDVSYGEDRIFWARLALKFDIAWSPTVGAIYQMDTENSSANPRLSEGESAYLNELIRIKLKCATNHQLISDIDVSILGQRRSMFCESVWAGHKSLAVKQLGLTQITPKRCYHGRYAEESSKQI